MRRMLSAGIVALLLSAGLTAPGYAANAGTLGIWLTGKYASGHVMDLSGATLVAENLDTGASVPVPQFGTSGSSPYYEAYNLPFGRYRIRISHPDFVTQWWPRQYSRDSASVVVFGDTAGCDPTAASSCDVHILSAELTQSVSLTGAVRSRSMVPAPFVQVSAERTDETTFRATTSSDARGNFAFSLPAGTYRLRTPNGNTYAETSVHLTAAAARDLTLQEAPSAPTQVTATAGNRNVTIRWQRPADDGGDPVSAFTATAEPGGSTCTTTNTSCTIAGLDNGRDYRFTVHAENGVGRGAASAATTPVRPTAGMAQPPTNVRVTRANRTLDVTWSASPGTDVVEYLATARPGGRSCSTTDLHCSISGLRNGRAYTVSVRAFTVDGVSEDSAPTQATTPAGPPGAPRSIRVTPKPSSLNVTWQAPLDDGGAPVRQYVATAWPGGATCQTDAATRCRISGLRSTIAYSVTLRAANAVGESPSSPGSAPTRPKAGKAAPSRVRGLRAVTRGGRTVVTWRRLPEASGYWVRLRSSKGASGPWSMVTGTTVLFDAKGSGLVEVRAEVDGRAGPVTRRRV